MYFTIVNRLKDWSQLQIFAETYIGKLLRAEKLCGISPLTSRSHCCAPRCSCDDRRPYRTRRHRDDSSLLMTSRSVKIDPKCKFFFVQICSKTNFRVPDSYAKIMQPDWLKLVVWLSTANQSALFQLKFVYDIGSCHKQLIYLRCDCPPQYWRICICRMVFFYFQPAVQNICLYFPKGAR